LVAAAPPGVQGAMQNVQNPIRSVLLMGLAARATKSPGFDDPTSITYTVQRSHYSLERFSLAQKVVINQ